MKKTKRYLFLILLILLQITINYRYSLSQSINNIDFQSIKKVLLDQEINWNEGNLDGYMEGYYKSDSLKFITKKGVTYGWENTLQKYRNSYPDKASMGQLKFEIINIEVLCDTKALLTGKWHLKVTGLNNSINEVSGYFTLIFQNFNGKWLIILDHTS